MPLERVREALLAILLLSPASIGWTSQTAADSKDLQSRAAELYARGDWRAVVRLIPDSENNSPELDYLRGMALARLGQRDEARRWLEAGSRKAPSDKRFLQELAGLAFQNNQLSETKGYLFRALALDSHDIYTRDFLGTVFLMEDNLEAALKFWNPIDKPVIESIQFAPKPRLKPELLDHAFQFAPSSLLRREEFILSQASLDQLGIFTSYRFELLPRPDSRFDLIFHPFERNRLGEGWLNSMVSLFRGTPAQIVYLELYNLRERAINWLSSYRWNAQKRRWYSSLSGTWHEDPRWSYLGWGDVRQENWDVSHTFQGAPMVLGDLRLETQKGGFNFYRLIADRWKWTSGVELAHRHFQNPPGQVSSPNGLFANGTSLKYLAGLEYRLLSIPEHRLIVWSTSKAEIGRQFNHPGFTFSRLREDVQARWYPLASGKDYAVATAFRTGKSFGTLPFDELFMLGMERGNDLPLHGHPGSNHGKKGSAYLGRDFLLLNTEFDKHVYTHPWFETFLGPLLDVGKTFDESGRFASPQWLWDLGIQAKVQARNGSTLSVSYGRSLRGNQRVLFIGLSK